jgi:hypothetical protein
MSLRHGLEVAVKRRRLRTTAKLSKTSLAQAGYCLDKFPIACSPAASRDGQRSGTGTRHSGFRPLDLPPYPGKRPSYASAVAPAIAYFDLEPCLNIIVPWRRICTTTEYRLQHMADGSQPRSHGSVGQDRVTAVEAAFPKLSDQHPGVPHASLQSLLQVCLERFQLALDRNPRSVLRPTGRCGKVLADRRAIIARQPADRPAAPPRPNCTPYLLRRFWIVSPSCPPCCARNRGTERNSSLKEPSLFKKRGAGTFSDPNPGVNS